ncbi:unnamed protein product, partial [Mesorhabditis belari]|uniref:Globin domain-containing protein n=1 Tax=Mesorhabditis belari TaxID=2138241 RepID=A0AAF3J4X2_9BILA
MIFNQCPETRYLFPKIDTFGHKKELRKNNEFVFQALRFMQVVESAMRNLDSLNNMNTILDNLGRRHGKLELVGKFRPYYWSVFLESMIFHVRKFLEANHRKFPEKEIDGAVIVWRTLLKDVVHRIKVGYFNDIEHRLNQLAESCQNQVSLHDRKRSTGSGNGHFIRESTVEDEASDDFRSSRCLPQRHPSTKSGFSNRKHFLKDHSLPEDF